jgi:hypothetical protein
MDQVVRIVKMRYKVIGTSFAEGITPMNHEVTGRRDLVDGDIIEAKTVKCDFIHKDCSIKLKTLSGHEYCSRYFFPMDSNPISTRKRYLRPIGE